MSKKKPFNLPPGGGTDDPAMEKVLRAQAEIKDLRREVAALKKDRDQILEEFIDLRDARPVPKAPSLNAKPPSADTVRVSFGDVHGMMQDPKAVATLLKDLRELRPDEIVLGGDILECGGWLAKHQPIGFIATCDYSYQEDCRAANDFLDAIQEIVPNARIDYIEGNHEDRVERWITDTTRAHGRDSQMLWDAFSPYAVLRLAERNIPYYRRSETYEDGLPRGWIKRGKMYFTHTLGKSKNAARDALQKTAGNVTFFCTHREDTATIVFPSVGLVKAFNPGCLCTMQPVWRNSDPTNWSQGYAVDFISKSGNFQRMHVPIWRGVSLASSMIERFKS